MAGLDILGKMVDLQQYAGTVRRSGIVAVQCVLFDRILRLLDNSRMKPASTLDRSDSLILAHLQREGRISNAELAERVRLSASACLRRVQRLESEGFISGYAARLDPQRLGLGLQAFVRLQLRQHDAATITRFVSRLEDWEEVNTCFALTGDMDYLLHVIVRDLDHFSHFLLDRLLRSGDVDDVSTSFVLRTVKQAEGLPIPGA